MDNKNGSTKFMLDARLIRLALIIAALVLLCVVQWRALMGVLTIVLTAAVIAFLLEPIAQLLSGMGVARRSIAVVLAFIITIVVLLILVLTLVPPVLAQMKDLSQLMRRSVGSIQTMLTELNRLLALRGLPKLDLMQIDWSGFASGLTGLITSSGIFAGNLIQSVSRFGFSLMLAFYFLLYKQNMLLSLELMMPRAGRKLTVQMAASVVRELRQYLKGQLMVSLMVAILTTIGFFIVGTPLPALMGLVVGAFNLIPYFGPVIGAVPAVLMALGRGLTTAIFTLAVVLVVQQLDGFVISPRVMGGIIGLSPTAVLLAITVGSTLYGVVGMFFAIPVVLIVRICLRVWASRNETIVNWDGM